MKKIAPHLMLCLLLAAFAVLLTAAHAETLSVPQSRPQLTLSFAPLVKHATPAVVNIYARRQVEQRVISPLFDDPFFRRFFQDLAPSGGMRKRLENALGSGVVVRPDGVIVTSNHVINGADEIRVALSDRREYDAYVIIADERSDLAVLRIDTKGENLPYLEIKDSDDAQVGDLVLAIGNPFGVGQTVTSGIISAMAHAAVGSSQLDYFIQTDAAINPGNSGGALITMDGKLVGINSAIYSRDGGNLGIGFAVPSNMVRVILNAVAQGEKAIVHPWLGIDGQEVTSEIAASMNMPQPTGYLVKDIAKNSPAPEAGLHVGDVILTINNHVIDDAESFHYRIATLPVGSMADMEILSKGRKGHIHVTLIAPPEIPSRDKTVVTGRNPFAGATLQNISPAVLEETGLKGIDHGVMITRVEDGTPASSIGLHTKDVITLINTSKIETVKQVLDAINQQSTGWRIVVQRNGNAISFMVGG